MKPIATLVLLGALATSSAIAQSSIDGTGRLAIGAYGAVNWSNHPDASQPRLFAQLEPAAVSGAGWAAGVVVAIPLGEQARLTPRLSYEVWQGRIERTATGSAPIIDSEERDAESTVRSAALRYETDYGAELVTMAMLFDVDVARLGGSTCLAIMAGPFSSIVVTNLRETVRLDEPPPARFDNEMGLPVTNDARTLTAFDDALPGAESFALGMVLGARVATSLTSRLEWWTQAQAQAQLPLQWISPEIGSAVALSLGTGLSVRL